MRLTPGTDHKEHITRNLRRERRRWDEGEALPMALGCVGCVDRELCGGIRKKQNHYSCLDDCCGAPEACDLMCPRNPTGFIDRMREVNGLELESAPSSAALRRGRYPLPTSLTFTMATAARHRSTCPLLPCRCTNFTVAAMG